MEGVSVQSQPEVCCEQPVAAGQQDNRLQVAGEGLPSKSAWDSEPGAVPRLGAAGAAGTLDSLKSQQGVDGRVWLKGAPSWV